MSNDINLTWNSIAQYESDIFDFISDEKRNQNIGLITKIKSGLKPEKITVGDILAGVLKVDPSFKTPLSYDIFFHYADRLSYHEKGILGASIACLSLKSKGDGNLISASLVKPSIREDWHNRNVGVLLKKEDIINLVEYIAAKPEAMDYFHLIDLQTLENSSKFISFSLHHQTIGEVDVLVASVQDNKPVEYRQKAWQESFDRLYLQWLNDNRDRTVNCGITKQEVDSIFHGYQQVSFKNKAKLLMDVVNESLVISEESPKVKKAFSFPKIAWSLLSDMDNKIKEINSSMKSPLDYCNKEEIAQDKVFVINEYIKGVSIELSSFKLSSTIAMWEVGNQAVKDMVPFMDGYQKPKNNVTATTNISRFFNYVKRKYRDEVNCEYMETEYSQNAKYGGKFKDKNYEVIFTSNNKDILNAIKEMLPNIVLYKELLEEKEIQDVIWDAKFESFIMRAELERIEQNNPVQNKAKKLKF